MGKNEHGYVDAVTFFLRDKHILDLLSNTPIEVFDWTGMVTYFEQKDRILQIQSGFRVDKSSTLDRLFPIVPKPMALFRRQTARLINLVEGKESPKYAAPIDRLFSFIQRWKLFYQMINRSALRFYSKHSLGEIHLDHPKNDTPLVIRPYLVYDHMGFNFDRLYFTAEVYYNLCSYVSVDEAVKSLPHDLYVAIERKFDSIKKREREPRAELGGRLNVRVLENIRDAHEDLLSCGSYDTGFVLSRTRRAAKEGNNEYRNWHVTIPKFGHNRKPIFL